MSDAVLVALIAFAGTVIANVIGILIANSLTKYRIGKLEEQVSKHNEVVERTYRLEEKVEFHDKEITDLKRELSR